MRLVFALPALLLASGPLHAQSLDLAQALALSDRLATSTRLSLQKVEEARGDLRAASAAYLPSVRLESAWGATTDPLGAFASRLGQRRIAAQDFNPAELNDPDAVPGWTAGVVTEVPLINIDAWKQVGLASGQVELRRLESRRALQTAHSDVLKAWHGLALARRSVQAWSKAAEAAGTARRDALSASEQGMSDRSKMLQARVRAAEIEAEFAKANAEESLAGQSLAVLLGGFPVSEGARIEGIAVDSLRLFSESLSASGPSVALNLSRTNHSLARADLSRARAAWLPRLNGLARLDWKGRGEPDDRDPAWTVGLAARWDLFQGLREWGEEASARARLAMAREGLASRERLEVLERNTWALRSKLALERLGIAEEAIEAAAEVSRVAQRKYAEGLMEQSEWLGALAEEAKAVVALEALRLEAVEALGNHAMALGVDPARMAERK